MAKMKWDMQSYGYNRRARNSGKKRRRSKSGCLVVFGAVLLFTATVKVAFALLLK
jgi:hypothetical protein